MSGLYSFCLVFILVSAGLLIFVIRGAPYEIPYFKKKQGKKYGCKKCGCKYLRVKTYSYERKSFSNSSIPDSQNVYKYVDNPTETKFSDTGWCYQCNKLYYWGESGELVGEKKVAFNKDAYFSTYHWTDILPRPEDTDKLSCVFSIFLLIFCCMLFTFFFPYIYFLISQLMWVFCNNNLSWDGIISNLSWLG